MGGVTPESKPEFKPSISLDIREIDISDLGVGTPARIIAQGKITSISQNSIGEQENSQKQVHISADITSVEITKGTQSAKEAFSRAWSEDEKAQSDEKKIKYGDGLERTE